MEEAKAKSTEIIKRKEEQAEQKILTLENDAINQIKNRLHYDIDEFKSC